MMAKRSPEATERSGIRSPDNLSLKQIKFTVDSALLRELGERLVGRPHIALAELIKNSYDADATKVIVRIESDKIEVVDNGHGMDFEEFRDFWMRIGTPHKQPQRVSRNLERPMTGSKGIGRLAVQFLAGMIEMHTVSERATDNELEARVDWDEAIEAGELTEAIARYREMLAATELPGDGKSGTAIILTDLKQDWGSDEITDLAREIWFLQPPFRASPDLISDKQRAFEIELRTDVPGAVKDFETQMLAYRDIWHARLVGELDPSLYDPETKTGVVHLSVEFKDSSPKITEYYIPNCRLHAADFEVRIYHLRYRQPYGISVSDAREYLNEFGGIHVYDAGFHLPYYGREDWLKTEIDHSHRRTRSRLLPEGLQVPGGLTYLPTKSRILGVMHVNTAKEREAAERSRDGDQDFLKISVTRDRLIENAAFESLYHMARWALDFYAMQEALRQKREAEAKRDVEPARAKFARVEQVLDQYKNEIPEDVYGDLVDHVREAAEASETEAEAMSRQMGLFGALATAGITTIAYEHEIGKQYLLLEDIASRLRNIKVRSKEIRSELECQAQAVDEWVEHARAMRKLYSPLMDEENRDAKARYNARLLVHNVKEQMGVLMRGAKIDIEGIDPDLRLPVGSFAEWSAIFQNVFVNAVNAMLDSDERLISIRSHARGLNRSLYVQDTGCGVQLESSEELFKPFVRKLEISPERRALGFGGTGMGLAIVRMIAQNLNCKVTFAEPEEGFSTSFRLSWREVK